MITYTTLDLIAAIKRIAHVPTASGSTFSSTDFLALADMAMRTMVSPKIASAREGYWTTYVDHDIQDSDTPSEFPIPGLALGSSIVEAKLLVSQNYLPLDRIEINELTSQQFTPRPNYGYYVEDNILKLLPNGGITGSLRIWYNRMPSQLVLPTACGQITEISGNDVTVGTLPSTFTTNTELDIVSENPGFNVLLKDSAPTAINNNTLTFDELPPRVKVGDYVCLSGQSCVVQCPLEWVEVLVQATTCKVYESQGYLTKLKAATEALSVIESRVLSLISPRQIQKTKYIAGGGGVLSPLSRSWPRITGRNQ